MLGPLANSSALVLGGVFGALLGRLVPRHIKETLPMTFGVLALAIGVTLVTKVHALPAVALAMILGTLIGELLYLEHGLETAIKSAQKRFERTGPKAGKTPLPEGFAVKFVTITVLFCASGMGIFGAIHEGMTGNADILLAKSVLDLFTAMIFATELGYAVALIAVPQLAIQSALHFGANSLMPLTTPTMLADFSACGGVIMLATGLRICGIKIFPIVNMLPALLLVMPVSALWARFFA